jgi:hypothetical protein
VRDHVRAGRASLASARSIAQYQRAVEPDVISGYWSLAMADAELGGGCGADGVAPDLEQLEPDWFAPFQRSGA